MPLAATEPDLRVIDGATECECWPLDTPAWAAPSMTELGHEDRFQRPSLSGCCGFGYATFAGARGNGRDAPMQRSSAYAVRHGRARPVHPFTLDSRIVAISLPRRVGFAPSPSE